MKTLNKIALYVGLGISFLVQPGCSLDTEPYDFAAPETFYTNEAECTMALAGIYYTLVEESTYGNFYSCMISNIDDLSFYARAAGTQTSQVFVNDHNTSNKNIYDAWASFYKGINNANMLLEQIDNASMDDKVKMRIKGEAKFLRAYYHFLLVQGWHEVPVRTESLKNINLSSMAATPHAEALDWIIGEMEDCVEMVDDEIYDQSPGHVKKTVVEGILARVCLWRAGYPANGGKPYYEKAARWANEVKKAGKHQLNPDIYAIWKNMACDKYDKTYNESMWEAEFIGTRDDGSYTAGRIGNVIGNMQANGVNTGKGYSYGFYSGSLILWDLFDKEDARRDLSMAPYQLTNKDEVKAWNQKQIVERRCGKFRREWESSSPKHKNYTQENFPLLRYADVLLMLAEAENEAHGAPTDLAYQCVNEVRTRAGAGEIKGLDYEKFKQLIRDERARELCFEGLRKYDLVRWGIYVEAIHDKLGAATQDARWSTASYFTGAAGYAGRTEAKHQFLPIPSLELSVNLQLEQNKYWK